MLTDQQRADYDRDGFLVLPGVVDREQCARLVERAAQIAAEAPAEKSVFTTTEQERVSDERFLSSGPRVTCFTEPDGVTLAKIGHALHDLDPVFAEFSRQPAFAEVAGDVGLSAPLLLQSMYLCKAARSGGEVGSHQDATFLYTDPVTVTGLWVALEDATVDNGCLWALPGGHRTVPLEKRFVRLGGDADGTSFVPVGDGHEGRAGRRVGPARGRDRHAGRAARPAPAPQQPEHQPPLARRLLAAPGRGGRALPGRQLAAAAGGPAGPRLRRPRMTPFPDLRGAPA